jgi:hypothetical protein
MNIQLEKEHIIEQIQQINDVDLIKALKSLLSYSQKKQEVELIPEWHKSIVRKRLSEAQAHPETLLTWDDMMQELDS